MFDWVAAQEQVDALLYHLQVIEGLLHEYVNETTPGWDDTVEREDVFYLTGKIISIRAVVEKCVDQIEIHTNGNGENDG